MIISYVKKRINLKIVLPFIAIVIIIAIFIIFWIGDIISNNIEVRVIENLRKSGFFTDRIINDNEKRAIFFAQFMSDMEKLYSQIPNTRLIHSLITYLLQILKENKMSVQLINKEENIKSTLIKKGFMGMRTSDILEELDGNELSLSIGAVAPIEEKDRIDKIVLIKFPFNKDFIQNMKGKIGADITLIYKNRIISSTLANSDCIGKIKNMISPQISRSIMDGENITADINCELHTQKILLRPISIGTKNRFIVGISLSLKNLRLTESRIRRTTIYITTLVLTLLAFVYYMITRKVVNPLKALSKATSEVAKGNLEQGIMVKTEDDEVGNLAKSFNKMVSEL
jgi:HAMP domain-containing protein